MKKSIKKTICSYLIRFVGHEIVRTKPTANGDWSYTADPQILLGFNGKGQMILWDSILGEHTVGEQFVDRNWKTKKAAICSKDNSLNQWKGRNIIRTCSVQYPHVATTAYMEESVELLSTSKYHMLIKDKHEVRLLNSLWNVPEEWILAE